MTNMELKCDGIMAELISSHVIKSAPLFWAVETDSTIMLRIHGVLLPHTLLLYNSVVDYSKSIPFLALDLQKCLAVQRNTKSNVCPGFILLIVPGGITKFGCVSNAELDNWIQNINIAMDTEFSSQELENLVETIFRISNDRTLYGLANSDYFEIITQENVDIKQMSEKNAADNISPVENESSQLTSEVRKHGITPDKERSNPNDIQVHDIEKCVPAFSESPNYNDNEEIFLVNEIDLPKEKENKTLTASQDKLKVDLPREIETGPNLQPNYCEDREVISKEIDTLNRMLNSQERAYNILFESCSCLKETISQLQSQLNSLEATEKNARESILEESMESIRLSASSKEDGIQQIRCDNRKNPLLRPKKARSSQWTGQTASITEAELKLNHVDGSNLRRTFNDSSTSSVMSTSRTLVGSGSRSRNGYTSIAVDLNDSILSLNNISSKNDKINYPCELCIQTLYSSLAFFVQSFDIFRAKNSHTSLESLKYLRSISRSVYSRLKVLLHRVKQDVSASETNIAVSVAMLIRDSMRSSRLESEQISVEEEHTRNRMQILVYNATIDICRYILRREATNKIAEVNENSPESAGTYQFNIDELGVWIDSFAERESLLLTFPLYILIRLIMCGFLLGEEKAVQNDLTFHENEIILLNTDSEFDENDEISIISESLSTFWIDTEQENEQENEVTFLKNDANFNKIDSDNSFDIVPLMGKLLSNMHLSKIFHGNDAHSSKSDYAVQTQNLNSPTRVETENPSHLVKLSLSLQAQREEFLKRFRFHESGRESDIFRNQIVQERDYTTAFVALQQKHEQEVQAMWEVVHTNWIPREEFEVYAAETKKQLQALHSCLRCNCVNNHAYSADDQNRQRLFILLRQVENASKCLMGLTRQNEAGELCSRDSVQDSIETLKDSARELRVLLYGNEFEGVEEDETELPLGENPTPRYHNLFANNENKLCQLASYLQSLDENDESEI